MNNHSPHSLRRLRNNSCFTLAVLLLLSIPFYSFNDSGYKSDEDRIIINRVEYFYRMKALLDKDVWPGFDHPDHEVPLVYYTDRHCYVANPTPRFLAIYNPPLIYKNEKLSIYKTALLDSASFHMETSMNVTDTAAYNYKSLFMACSSYEITIVRRPDAEVKDLERWATLVLHEYFHGFQFTNTALANYHQDSILPVPVAGLRTIYDDNEYVKNTIDAENDLLLQAIKADTKKRAVLLLDSFFIARTNRRDLIKGATGFDMGKYEEFYETVEGTARYIEYGMINTCKKSQPYKTSFKSDTAFHNYGYFRTYELENDPPMFLTSKTNYAYAIGFNMTRLADKFGLPYKKMLFKDPDATLEKILRSFVADNK